MSSQLCKDAQLTTFEIGDSIGPHHETITTEQVLRFMNMRPKMVGDGRFTDLAAAKELGLKGLIVPGPLQGAILSRVVRKWAPEAVMTKLDIVFRRNILQGQEVIFEGMVVDTDEEARTAEVDLLIYDSALEKLVTGAATLHFPA